MTRQTAAFNREESYWLDVEQFETALGEPTAGFDAAHARAAIQLYQDDFLAGLDVRGASAFDEWVIQQRTWLHNRAVQALENLRSDSAQRGDLVSGIEFIRRLLILEPWREEAHRQLMWMLAHSGQFNAALIQFENCCQSLRLALEAEPTTETVELFERIRTAAKSRRCTLPVTTTPFVGRKRELASIQQYLADPACRLLSLVGPGGIGKTRLAIQAASASANQFLDGVVFAELAAIETPALLATTLANALQLPLQGRETPEEQVSTYLQSREMLLVLDNLESPSASARLLTMILTHAPQVKFIVTTRERLNLQAAWSLDVASLAYPLTASEPSIEEYDAVQLFCQTARRQRSDFVLNAANGPAVVRICQLVDGVPLGIELAAMWVRALSCAEIVAELEQGLDILRTTRPDIPLRHRSLKTVLQYSWERLSAEQRRAVAKLGVFRGGFRRDAAQRIAGVTLNDLAMLVDRSFLYAGPTGRYTMHELMRQFALEQLRNHIRRMTVPTRPTWKR